MAVLAVFLSDKVAKVAKVADPAHVAQPLWPSLSTLATLALPLASAPDLCAWGLNVEAAAVVEGAARISDQPAWRHYER
jgi:hypothetical protein